MKNFFRDRFVYFLDYIGKTDMFLIFMSGGASVLSFFLMMSLYPAQISSLRTVYVQVASSFVGFVLAIIISNIDYHHIAKMWKPIAIFSVLFTLLTLTPLGRMRGEDGSGSADRSWVNLGFTRMQPSEFLKAAFVITFSYHCFKVAKRINQPKTFMLLIAHAYNFKFKKIISTFILAVMMIPTQVTALGFLQLVGKMKLEDNFWSSCYWICCTDAVFDKHSARLSFKEALCCEPS